MIYRYTKTQSNIKELDYYPQLLDFSNDDDAGDWGDKEYVTKYNGYGLHFTKCNEQTLLRAIKLADNLSSILEIGVHRPTHQNDISSTQILLREKAKSTIYLGIDLEDKSDLNDSENNIYTVQCNSSDYNTVYKTMNDLKITTFDFIFIDGWHSMNQFLLEWEFYVTKLAVGGVVAFHDSNYHPGPSVTFDAINTEMFTKERCCVKSDDFGLSIAKRVQ